MQPIHISSTVRGLHAGPTTVQNIHVSFPLLPVEPRRDCSRTSLSLIQSNPSPTFPLYTPARRPAQDPVSHPSGRTGGPAPLCVPTLRCAAPPRIPLAAPLSAVRHADVDPSSRRTLLRPRRPPPSLLSPSPSFSTLAAPAMASPQPVSSNFRRDERLCRARRSPATLIRWRCRRWRVRRRGGNVRQWPGCSRIRRRRPCGGFLSGLEGWSGRHALLSHGLTAAHPS